LADPHRYRSVMVLFKINDGEVMVHGCEITMLEVYSGKFKGTGTQLVKRAEEHMRKVERCHTAYVFFTQHSKGFWKKMGYDGHWVRHPYNLSKKL
jgi:N-acetylglutamate synthase-like GNAT family acetyltransferase